MTYEDIIKKLRMFLADADGAIWSNEDLHGFIVEAIRQYSFDSGFYCDSFSFAPQSDGVYKLPDNFAQLLIGWNSSGGEVTVSNSAEYLPFVSGTPVKYIISDLSSTGEYQLLPKAKNLQNLNIAVFSSVYGEVEDSQFGVFEDDKFGISYEIAEFDFIGDAVYSRVADIQEVKDYMPIIYYAIYIAYSGDYEYSNSEMAQIYLARYKQRMAAYDTVKKDLYGRLNLYNFY